MAGDQAQRDGDGYLAKGYFGRASDLNGDLTTQSPAYAQANANYGAASRVLDAIPVGRDVLKHASTPAEFASTVGAMSPPEVAAAQVGARQAMVDAFGAPAENATGVVNRVATGTNVGQNLEALFGQDATSDLQGGLSDEMARLSNARYVSPNTGSQTATRAADSGHWGIPNIAGLFKDAASNTPEENAALFKLATSDPATVAAQLMARPDPMLVSPTAAYYLTNLANLGIASSNMPAQ